VSALFSLKGLADNLFRWQTLKNKEMLSKKRTINQKKPVKNKNKD